MTKAACLHSFWSGFGLTAYEENSVPDASERTFPYITYEVVTGSFGDEQTLNASLWYRDTSWVSANSKAQQISTAISGGGKMMSCDGGAIYITRAPNFSQHMSEESDDKVKRILLTVSAEFLTEN